MDLLLKTPRCIVRRLTNGDVDRLTALDAAPDVMRYINGGSPTPRAVVEKKLKLWTAGYDAARPSGFWAIEISGAGQFVGWVHLKPDRWEPALDELGYRLRPEFWGRGLATEVGKAMVEHAYSVWQSSGVVARTLMANRASQRVMEKIGMTREFEFEYPESMLPGWTPAERAAVRYRAPVVGS